MKTSKLVIIASLILCLMIQPIANLSAAKNTGEVLNFAPVVDFEMKEKKKVDVIVDVGNTSYSIDEVKSLVNQTLRSQLQEAGYDYKLHVEKSYEGMTKFYYFTGDNSSDSTATTLYSYDILSKKSEKLYRTGYTLNDFMLEPETGLIFSSHYVMPTDLSPITPENYKIYNYRTSGSYSPMLLPDGTILSNSTNDYIDKFNNKDVLQSIMEGRTPQRTRNSFKITDTFYFGNDNDQAYLDGSILFYESGRIYHLKNTIPFFFENEARNVHSTSGLQASWAGGERVTYSTETGEVIYSKNLKLYTDGRSQHQELNIYNPKTGEERVFSPNLTNRTGVAQATFINGLSILYKDAGQNAEWKYLSDYRDPTTEKSLEFLQNYGIDPTKLTLTRTVIGDYIVLNVSGKTYLINFETQEVNQISAVGTGPSLHSVKLPPWYVAKTRYITDIIEEVPYRSDAEKFYIRLDHQDIMHLRDNRKLSKTINTLLQQQIAYIGIGNENNVQTTSKIQSTLSQNLLQYDIADIQNSLTKVGKYITERKEVDLHVLVAQSGQTKAQIESAVQTMKNDLLNENIILTPFYYYGTASSTLNELYNNIKWNEEKNQYLLFLNTAAMDQLQDSDYQEGIALTLKANYAHYLQIGSTSNRSIAEAIIALNENKGKFYNGTSYNTYYQNMKQYIIDTALKNPKRINNTLVLQHDPVTNEYSAEINVNLFYEDAENDRKRNERFRTTQDPTVYENHTGLMDGIGQYLEAPTTRFTKVGLYEMTMQAQDEPIADPALSEYWKWSKDSLSMLRLYVHRAPVAKFSAVVKPNKSLTITDYSYDLDRYSYSDHGLVQWEWKWKKVDDSSWQEGKITQLANNTDYFIALKVKDLDGAWSNDYIQFVTTNPYNNPPVSLFKIDPSSVSHRANATITDLSYDPDGDAIIKREWIAKKDGVVIWNHSTQPTKAQLQTAATNVGLNQLGQYQLSLRVTDAPGEMSEWHTEWLEVVNYPPFANFEDIIETDRDTLNKLVNTTVEPDQDGDPVSYTWTLRYKEKNYSLGSTKNPQFTIKNFGLGKAAVGTWEVTLQAKDPLGASSTLTKMFEVINHTPIAQISSSPPYAYIDEKYSFTSNDDDQDSEDKGSLTYYWKLTPPSGKARNFTTKDVTNIMFDEKGKHTMEHWVEDQLGAISEIAKVEFNVLNKRPVADFSRTPITTYRNVDIDFKSLATDYDGYIEFHRYELLRTGQTPLTLSTNADFTRSFSSIGTFEIRQTVTDNDGASDSIMKQIYIVNRAPKAEVTDPSGKTAATATEFNTLTPTIRWTMTDADNDPQVQYQLQLKNQNGTVLQTTPATKTANKYYTIPNGWLTEGPIYRVSVRVYDGYDWGEYSTDKYFYIMLNRPPVSSFTCTPNPGYEGDTVTCTNTSTDPDGDTMTFLWTVKGPNGYSVTHTTKDITIPRSITENRIGEYNITLRATDSKNAVNETDAKGKVNILPLTIEGEVNHTDVWEQNRLKWNQGNPTDIREANVFFAGEGFNLVGKPTVTSNAGGSTTIASRVDVTATSIGSTSLTKQTAARWTGYIGQENAAVQLEKLADGPYEFEFKVTYSNGVVKTDKVTIYIRDNWLKYHQFHKQF